MHTLNKRRNAPLTSGTDSLYQCTGYDRLPTAASLHSTATDDQE